ncbi:cytochrome c [Kordiimonas sediminis]|uniref:Cytochrome c n=1 Tax=Kordiimonas sediminis TaxID=1735581 RepID=A0A919E516_9PROT|nr:cytochrome c [Kordiimonas sediminis]GHF12928.1 cytochrome c [Kordiimonas sediminis]
MKSKTLSLLVATSVLAGISTASIAQEKKDPTLAYRHHAMELIKDAAGSLVAIMKGEGNAADFEVHAKVLAASAHGSKWAFEQKVAGGETKDAAWKNWDDFSSKLDEFVVSADALHAASDGDMAAKAAAFKSTMSTCKACHDDYREEH